MKDKDAVKDIKQRFQKYSSAVVKYCKTQPRNSPFVKNLLRDLQVATTREPVSIESTSYNHNLTGYQIFSALHPFYFA